MYIILSTCITLMPNKYLYIVKTLIYFALIYLFLDFLPSPELFWSAFLDLPYYLYAQYHHILAIWEAAIIKYCSVYLNYCVII